MSGEGEEIRNIKGRNKTRNERGVLRGGDECMKSELDVGGDLTRVDL